MTPLSPTAEDILRCAHTLIVAGGYQGFSYADIGEKVGIRNASIHHHFPTKAGLVRTLVVRYRATVEAGIAQLEREVPDPVERLRAYTRYWETCIAEGTAPFCVCALLASQLPALPEEVAQEVRAHFRTLAGWLTTVLERGANQGRLRLTGPAATEADVFMATVHGAMLSARAYGEAGAFAAIASPLVERLIAPGSTSPGAPAPAAGA